MSIQGELLISHGQGQGAPESLMPHGNTLTPYGDTLITHGGAGETITHQGGLRDGPGDRLSGLEDTPTTCGELGSGMEGSHDSEDTPTLRDRPRDSLTPHDELNNLDSYADTLFISGLQNPVSRKRGERPSPLPSPMKLTRSPAPKLQRRLRTGTEGKYPQDQLHVHPQEFPHCPIHQSRHLTLSHFLCNDNERDSQHELESEMNSYIIHRVVFANNSSQHPFLGLQDYCSLIRSTHTEVSKVIYLEVLDAVADCKDTMMVVLHNLRTRFIEERKMRWLVLEGDAKLYEVLKNLTFEYGEELNWLIPYPGDFHMLMNYQKALTKPYYDAGLKKLAQAAGYPLPTIQSCSQFKRTHLFLLETWEAIYRVMVLKYEEVNSGGKFFFQTASTALSITTENLPSSFSEHLKLKKNVLQDYFVKFHDFIQKMARIDDTWRFWVQFVFVDAMAYISLFLAVRSGDWDLRLAGVKATAPVFTAFDHNTYQKLISQHLEDIATMPAPITAMFRQGAFVISVTGRSWHSVAIDEGHEMLINKDCKTSIIHP